MLLKKFLNLSKDELEEFLRGIDIDGEVVDNMDEYRIPAFDMLEISGYISLCGSIVKKNQLPLNIILKHYGVCTCSIFIKVVESNERVEIVYNYETKKVRRILYFDPTDDVKWVDSLKEVKWVGIPQTLILDGETRNSNN